MNDAWILAEAHNGESPALCRWRTPVLGPPDVDGYERVLKVLWIYGQEGWREFPTEAQSQAMQVFENRLCDAWERDGLAYLAAVLTFDGARQWVFYTDDVQECGHRLNQMPQEQEPYPLELTNESDPEWSWLRENILKRFVWRTSS